jgi:hypothetical protein
MRTIVTLKWGTLYGPEYVNRLYRAVARHLPGEYRFMCLTDDSRGLVEGIETHPIPLIDLPPDRAVTGWRKLCLFREDAPLSGSCLFLDLDLVITGDLGRFFEFEPTRIPIIHNWTAAHKTLIRKRPEIGNSSVFRFEGGRCGYIFEQFQREREWALANFHPPQTYLTHCIRPRMVYWPETWVRSFKRHCRPAFPLNLFRTPALPEGCSIVAFHGRPNPDEAIGGYRGKKPHHHTRPAPWIAEHWT